VGCSLPSRIVRESAAETTIRIFATVFLLFGRREEAGGYWKGLKWVQFNETL
jgi:hypothetical protein